MNLTKNLRSTKGFTLIEVLLVIAIIAILAAIVIIAVNPARQIAQSNNAQRRANVNAILNAVGQYAVDNRGSIPTAIPAANVATTTYICQTTAASTSTCIDLHVLTDNQLYLSTMPSDPTSNTTNLTGYYIYKSTSTNPRITVIAPHAENSETISVTR